MQTGVGSHLLIGKLWDRCGRIC